MAEEISLLAANHHHFKKITFSCSKSGKTYEGGPGDNEVLKIVDLSTGLEIPNNAKPSKKEIIGQAIKDIDNSYNLNETTYQRYRRLTKLINKKY